MAEQDGIEQEDRHGQKLCRECDNLEKHLKNNYGYEENNCGYEENNHGYGYEEIGEENIENVKQWMESCGRCVEVLVKKLKIYGLQDDFLSRIDSYLSERYQGVWIDHVLSEFLLCEVGVPQGGILGPLLFML